jgi:hypothetical protein
MELCTPSKEKEEKEKNNNNNKKQRFMSTLTSFI